MADDAKGEEGEQKSGGGISLVGILLASVLAAGGGAFLGWSQFAEKPPEKHSSPRSHGKDEPHKAGDGEKYTDGTRIRDLQPITTNLAGQPAAWIRLEASVVLGGEDEPKEKSSEEVEMLRLINEDVVAYLRTLTVAQIQGPSGFQSLREDLDERVRIRSEGKVTELIVQSMVLE